MKLTIKSKILRFVDDLKNIPIQLLGVIGYLCYAAPTICAIASLAALFAVLIVESIAKVVPLKAKAKSKYVCCLAISILGPLTIATPSYALFEGLETALGTIITAAGAGADATLATTIVTIFEVAVYMAFIVVIALLIYNRRDEEQVMNLSKAGVAMLVAVIMLQVGGNIIFGAGGGGGGGTLPPQ